ncbi:MAG TPA: TetR/AcrR family transcriptional regulator [Xanthomonadaceae bacterium]|nr:TetR/AcrR family transcriptional regulator [Xanthomonadaceae bacterium]
MNASSRQQQKSETRQRILAAAEGALRLRGIEAPSVSEVMAEAGLTVGGFYAHFDSKQALMQEALAEVLAAQREVMLEAVEASPGPQWRQLAARKYLSRGHRDAQQACCPLPAVMSQLIRADPSLRGLLAEHLEAFIVPMIGADEDAESARRTALADLALMIGAYSLARALGPLPLSDELLAAARQAVR